MTRHVPRQGTARPPLPPAPITGWKVWAFWALRLYIAAMLVVMALGFRHVHP